MASQRTAISCPFLDQYHNKCHSTKYIITTIAKAVMAMANRLSSSLYSCLFLFLSLSPSVSFLLTILWEPHSGKCSACSHIEKSCFASFGSCYISQYGTKTRLTNIGYIVNCTLTNTLHTHTGYTPQTGTHTCLHRWKHIVSVLVCGQH